MTISLPQSKARLPHPFPAKLALFTLNSRERPVLISHRGTKEAQPKGAQAALAQESA